jgi:monoamine oxidase
VEDRLFFAGEACSRGDYSTAHGAYLSGVAAAEAVIAARKISR